MRENKYLEFKSEITNTFLKTVSAYSNYGDGVIKFGINDDGTVCGVNDPENVCLNIENKINDSIRPKPDYSLSINRKQKVITLTVSEGRYKPYLYKGKAYKRNDTSSVEVEQVELRRLTLEGSNLYFEELPGTPGEYTFTFLEKKLIEKLGIAELTRDMLRTFGFYTEKGNLNIAGELFADHNSLYGIDIARFGKTINEILDHETYSGISILQQYDKALSMFRRYYQYEEIKGSERIKIDTVPEVAYREAVANALVHRTWDINSNIRISMYTDKIEIASPGGLPAGLTREEYLNGSISNLRNPVIGNMFFRMHYIEMFGTGIRRIKAAYREYVHKPGFDITDNSITITLPNTTKGYTVTAEGRKLIDLLNNGMLFSSREIADQLGWSKAKVIRTVNKLKDSGYLKVTGSGRGIKYSKS